MKIKCRPEDFRVEELPSVQPGDQGPYVFYRLVKRDLGTPEAIESIRRRWDLNAAQIHYGGMKDRHAETVQYLTILNGPSQPLHQDRLDLEPLGRLRHPYGSQHFRGNRFEVVVRELSDPEARRARLALADLAREGLPNYFDDQRFGSLGRSGEFIGRAWLQGDYERALYLAIAEPTESDRPGTRTEKATLRECWNHWAEAKTRLERSHARSLVTYLVDHPTDHRGAFARIRRDLRSLYFSAYQSHLWNLILARRITQVARPDQVTMVAFRSATLPVHHGLDPAQVAELSAWPIPLPCARGGPPSGPAAALSLAVIEDQGLQWSDLRIKHLKDVFFSKGHRSTLFHPAGLRHQLSPDDLYRGRSKLAVTFELPKGSYATLVVKRLTELPGSDPVQDVPV